MLKPSAIIADITYVHRCQVFSTVSCKYLKAVAKDLTMQSKLKELMEICSRNYRVCPHPMEWERLWKMILDRKRKGERWSPPRPLILAAWWETSIGEKRHRLRQHIRWAYEHEIFEKVDRFLRNLSEEQWYHTPKN